MCKKVIQTARQANRLLEDGLIDRVRDMSRAGLPSSKHDLRACEAPNFFHLAFSSSSRLLPPLEILLTLPTETDRRMERRQTAGKRERREGESRERESYSAHCLTV